MTETTTTAAPADPQNAVVRSLEQTAPKEGQPRGEGGKFAQREPAPGINQMKSIQESAHAAVKDALRKQYAPETDKAALDTVKPKGQGEKAKTDPAPEKDASATGKAKPEPTSKDATRQLTKARKALELEGWTEDDLDGLADDKVLSLGTKYQEKHAKADREKRDAAEAAKKSGTQSDPAAQSGSATNARAANQDADEAEYVKLAEEHFKGFEAETDEGTKAFRTSQARFVRSAIEKGQSRLTAGFEERMTSLEQSIRGEARLERALDRVAIDIPQLEDKDVRSKAIAHVLSLVTGDDTREEYSDDLPGAIRAAAAALKLKDEGAAKRAAADEEFRAAKDGGQVITSSTRAAEREPQGNEIFQHAVRKAMNEARK